MAPNFGASLGKNLTARKTRPEVLFQVTSAKRLSKALKAVNPVVPPRHMQRQTWETERYSVVRLLKSLPRYRLPFPISLVHDDKPDFVLTVDGDTVAIEAVEAVSQVEAHQSDVIGGLVASGAMPSPIQAVVLRSPTDPVMTKAQAAVPVTAGHFYAGNQVEENWIEAMKHFIGGKLLKFPSYATASRNWLMVYDNWPSIMLKLDEASEQLHDWLVTQHAYAVVETVFILHGSEIVEFRSDGFRVRPLRIPRGKR